LVEGDTAVSAQPRVSAFAPTGVGAATGGGIAATGSGATTGLGAPTGAGIAPTGVGATTGLGNATIGVGAATGGGMKYGRFLPGNEKRPLRVFSFAFGIWIINLSSFT
jgi:hypothetical protein